MQRPRILLHLSAAGLAAVLTALLAVASQPAPTVSALTNCTVADSDVALDAEEARFLQLINNYRAQNGLQPLTVSTNLNRAAAWMALDLGQKNYFAHTDSLGRSPSTRAQDCGYPGGAGENLAAGTVRDTAQEAFDAWKASPGHNQNMLNGSYRMIGIARAYVPGSTYGWYWVTPFGLVDDGTSGGGGVSNPQPTPTPPPPTPTPPPPTPTPTAPPPPPTQAPIAKASMISPVPGSTIRGGVATFTWSAGSGAQEYFLYVGTRPGSNNILGLSTGTNRSLTVYNMPRDGGTLYVRLWTRFSTGWGYTDYTYRTSWWW